MSESQAITAAHEFIPVYKPDLSGNEKAYVNQCLDSEWISSLGEFIDRFETAFSHTTNLPHTISVSNGTVALHLVFHALGLRPGDEVIVPSFTYIASVNTIVQTGATPVFVDCRPGDWLIDPEDVAARITPRTRAIVAVHLYGAVCDMAALRRIADAHGLYLIEDCAEALGSTRDGQHVGELGDAATFSFFGNKTVTTGEGGMIGVSDPGLADRIRLLKSQGQSPTRRYWHVELGFNYRMTNICAAIGLAQLERLHENPRAQARYRSALPQASRGGAGPLPEARRGRRELGMAGNAAPARWHRPRPRHREDAPAPDRHPPDLLLRARYADVFLAPPARDLARGGRPRSQPAELSNPLRRGRPPRRRDAAGGSRILSGIG